MARALAQLLITLLIFHASFSFALTAPDVCRTNATMTSIEVTQVIAQAISRAAQISPDAVIAVVDREGFVLGVWSMNGDTNSDPAKLNLVDAITKAGTASFLSSDEHAFTSRTAGFIVQQHFPPGIQNRPNGPLVGVNFSNFSFTDVNRFKNPLAGHDAVSGLSGTNGDPIVDINDGLQKAIQALTGLAGSPGGVPLFRDRRLIGGVGVAGRTQAPGRSPFPALADIQVKQAYDPDEDVALAGQIGFAPPKDLLGSRVFIDGIRVPYVKSKTRLGVGQPLGTLGSNVVHYPITNSPVVFYPCEEFGGQMCEVRAPIMSDITGNIDAELRLNSNEVREILSLASARARITRAGIRLPRGKPSQNFITVVNNPNQPGVAPQILGTIRTPDATHFSWDVAIQKARTAVFFSDSNRAFSTRTVGFLAQRFYPPGIENTPPGPFYSLQEKFSLLPAGITNPLNLVVLTNDLNAPDLDVPNGITIFPGGFPLYRSNVLVGAIGVSGDGIDQDDIIAVAGTVNFLPPANIRADHMQFRGARLPYAKFPRNPDL